MNAAVKRLATACYWLAVPGQTFAGLYVLALNLEFLLRGGYSALAPILYGLMTLPCVALLIGAELIEPRKAPALIFGGTVLPIVLIFLIARPLGLN